MNMKRALLLIAGISANMLFSMKDDSAKDHVLSPENLEATAKYHMVCNAYHLKHLLTKYHSELSEEEFIKELQNIQSLPPEKLDEIGKAINQMHPSDVISMFDQFDECERLARNPAISPVLHQEIKAIIKTLETYVGRPSVLARMKYASQATKVCAVGWAVSLGCIGYMLYKEHLSSAHKKDVVAQ